MNKTLVLYTHTDMQDVWDMCFGQIQKYLTDYKVYVLLDKPSNAIPQQFNQVIYEDRFTYTERLQHCMQYISEDVVLFLHEDMVLYDSPNYELLDTYTDLIERELVDGVKLILVGDSFTQSHIHPTLVVNEHSKFSVQPTLVRKSALLDLVTKAGALNIWDFEASIPGLPFFGCMCMVRVGGEKKRGLFHYDSPTFPYIATAIVKGRWNYSEYASELDMLFQKYKIDTTIRGTI